MTSVTKSSEDIELTTSQPKVLDFFTTFYPVENNENVEEENVEANFNLPNDRENILLKDYYPTDGGDRRPGSKRKAGNESLFAKLEESFESEPATTFFPTVLNDMNEESINIALKYMPKDPSKLEESFEMEPTNLPRSDLPETPRFRVKKVRKESFNANFHKIPENAEVELRNRILTSSDETGSNEIDLDSLDLKDHVLAA